MNVSGIFHKVLESKHFGVQVLQFSRTKTSLQLPASFVIMVFFCFDPFKVLIEADFTSTLITAAEVVAVHLRGLLLSSWHFWNSHSLSSLRVDVVEPPAHIVFARLLLPAELVLVEEVLQQLLGFFLRVIPFLEAAVSQDLGPAQDKKQDSSKQLLLYRSNESQSSKLLTTALGRLSSWTPLSCCCKPSRLPSPRTSYRFLAS